MHFWQRGQKPKFLIALKRENHEGFRLLRVLCGNGVLAGGAAGLGFTPAMPNLVFRVKQVVGVCFAVVRGCRFGVGCIRVANVALTLFMFYSKCFSLEF